MFLTENYVSCETERVNYNWGQFGCFELKEDYKNEHTGEVVVYQLPQNELEKYLNNLRINKKQNINKKYMVK